MQLKARLDRRSLARPDGILKKKKLARLVSYRGPGRPVVPGRRRPVVPARPSVYCPGFSQSIFLNVPVVPARLFVREGGGSVSSSVVPGRRCTVPAFSCSVESD